MWWPPGLVIPGGHVVSPMPWDNSPAKRQRDSKVYGLEYRRNREVARKRANGNCEGCHHRHSRLECDHIVATTQGGTHSPANLRMLCKGPGTCGCHDKKTAGEGGGWRAAADPAPRPRTRW